MLLLLVLLLVAISIPPIRADENDEYVREVLEEDQEHHNDYYNEDDEQYNRRQQQQEDAQERAAREAADRKANEREQKFERELDRMKDDEERKLAMKQKKRDGRRVKSVLKAFAKEDYYGVLGMNNFSIKTPQIPINIANVAKFTIPSLTLKKGPTDQSIKKQFRQRAMQVHPDKNKDGRAEEAFVAVQNAASVLGDSKTRQQYDQHRKEMRSQQLDTSKQIVSTTLNSVWAVLKKILQVCQTLLGPFFVPVAIIAALII